MSSTITIVTATYDRPELLRQVIRAVRCQSIESWRWIIVGDACSAETGEMIAAFDDPRITYINLPERFGEQAGPNSVGLALANTPCVALLNHDDLWLPDHLAVGLDTLRESGGDLCITRAAFVGPRGPETAERYVFAEQSPKDRASGDAYEAPFYLFEPVSSWIGTRDFFARLGPMGLATNLDVQPIRDWVMRIARLGAAVEMSDAVTVLKRFGRIEYGADESHMDLLVSQIEAAEIDEIREQIADDLWLSAQVGAARAGQAPQPVDGRCGSGEAIHRRCAIDRTSLDLAARRAPGSAMRTLLHRRTGQSLVTQPDISEAIAYARQFFD